MSNPRTAIDSKAVFVMGLPRSGSTLLSRLLNDSPDILSVNDLYFLQGAQAMGVMNGTLNRRQASELTDRLLEVIDTRANSNEAFIGQFQISPARIDGIRRSALARQDLQPFHWAELMDTLMGAVAASVGKTTWADKTPQNFYHFDLLQRRFPGAKFIYLFRDPRAILASYKFASGAGHDMRRYHPAVYALYWRSAVRHYQQVAAHPRVMMLRYEDIVSGLATVRSRLSEFLDTSISTHDLASLGHNSSFRGGQRRSITETETRLCQAICGKEMAALGYTAKPASIQLSGLGELAVVSARFGAFQISRLLGDRDARKRIGNFVSGLVRH